MICKRHIAISAALAIAAPATAPAAASVPAAHRDSTKDVAGGRALNYYTTGDLDGAHRQAELAKGTRASATAEAVRGLVELRRGRHTLAEKSLRRALTLDPDSSIAHEGMGRLLMRGNQGERALGHLRRAVDLDNCNWRAIMFLGMWQYQQKHYRLAASLLREAATIARDSEVLSSVLWFNVGLAHAAQDQAYLAARAYRRSIAIEPDRLEANNNLGILLIDSEQYDEAQKVLTAAVQNVPDNPQLEYLLGASYYLESQASTEQKQESGRALTHLKRAYDLGHRNPGLWVALGWSALGGRDLDLAERCFKQMLADAIDRPEAQKGLGYVYLRKREFERSRRFFERSLEQVPKDARTLAGLASLAIEEDKGAEALTRLDEAIAIDPSYADAVYKKGTTLMKLGRKEEGAAALARFQEMKDEAEQKRLRSRASHEAMLRAQEALNDGRLDEAVEILAAAIKQNPDGKILWIQHGQALLRAGRAKEAISPLEQALKLDPKLAVAHEILSQAHSELGDAAAAKREAGLATTKRFAKKSGRKAGEQAGTNAPAAAATSPANAVRKR